MEWSGFGIERFNPETAILILFNMNGTETVVSDDNLQNQINQTSDLTEIGNQTNSTLNTTGLETQPGIKVSAFFLFGYLIYWILVFVMLKFLKFDLVYGLAKTLR